jgi:hypothetical protein
MSEEDERRNWVAQAKQEALASWEGKRGVHSIERNGHAIHVRATVEETAAMLARSAVRWEQDVLDKPVNPRDRNLLVFRLRGHSWSIVVDDGADAQALSQALQTDVIDYAVTDTFGAIGYTLFEKGERIETFSGSEDGSNKFRSTLRSVPRRARKNIWNWVDEFFRSRDAFEPGLAYESFFRDRGEQPSTSRLILLDSPAPDTRPRVRNPGKTVIIDNERVVSEPDFERIDLVVLRDKPRQSGRILLG